MNMHYSIELKKKLCTDICFNGKSTVISSKEYNVPLKTLEKWITNFNKDPRCFDTKLTIINDFKPVNTDILPPTYDDLSPNELKNILMKKDIQIARLKKGYLVKEGGTKEKVFVSFSKKNMK